MYSSKTVHQTFVHHMALDSSGTLLASCSSDKTVNIFYRNAFEIQSGPWSLCCVLRDHVAPVTRLAWCLHRERGPLLATVGADRWIYIYKIRITSQGGKQTAHAMKFSSVRGYEKDVITDVAFSPSLRHHVLLLSTASLDGCVRMYDIHPLQFFSMYTITEETGIGKQLDTRQGGVTSIAFFPSSVDEVMTLAVGYVNGCVYIYRLLNGHTNFERLRTLLPDRAEGYIHHILWGPSVGRSFQLLVICCRTCVYIVRLNCVSPALEEYECDIFRWPRGAVCASWSPSATLLYLVSDDESTQITVLRTRDPSDHRSWEEVSYNLP